MKTCPSCGAQAINTARVCLRCKAVFPEGMEIKSVPHKQVYVRTDYPQKMEFHDPKRTVNQYVSIGKSQTTATKSSVTTRQEQTKAQVPPVVSYTAPDSFTPPLSQHTASGSSDLIFPKSVSTPTPVHDDDRTDTGDSNEIGPNERKGRRNAVIGSVVLGLLGLGIMGYLFAYGELNLPSVVIGVIAWMICGAIYGFGYTFGMEYVIDWTCKGLHVAAVTTMWALLIKAVKREDHMGPWALVMIIFSATFGLAYGWIPGVFRGIKLIKEERRQVACQN